MNGSYCLMGMKCSVLQDEKSSGDWLYNNVNGLNTIEFTNAQDDKLYVVHFTTVKNEIKKKYNPEKKACPWKQ